MNKNPISISDAAKRLGRSVKTLQRYDREGTLVAHRSKTGRRYYDETQLGEFLNIPSSDEGKKVIVYCRVSSNNQKNDLKNQRRVLEEFCTSRGLNNPEYVEEIGGGLNFKRPKFLKLVHMIVNNEVKTLVLAHKDRLARFGFELLAHLCELYNVEILLLNNQTLSPEQEMVQDLMTIIHCFSSRLYGLRKYGKQLKTELNNNHE